MSPDMEPLLNWWQFTILAIAFGALLVSIYKLMVWNREMSWDRRRRAHDADDADNLGERKQWDHPDDGPPGGSRKRIWSTAERQLYRDRHRNELLRLVGRTCPPHDPEYDPDVNETYCSRCMERLPNE